MYYINVYIVDPDTQTHILFVSQPSPCFPHPSAHQDRSNNYTTQQEHPNLGRPPTMAAREASGRSKSGLKKWKPTLNSITL